MKAVRFIKKYVPLSIWTKTFSPRIKFSEKLADMRLKLSMSAKRKMKRVKYLEVHFTEHCNLNCCSCAHFSPLADPEFIDIEEFSNDMRRLKDLSFLNKCGELHLLGGEPLLHPGIIPLMKIARQNFGGGG